MAGDTDSIRSYWDEQAQRFQADPRATTPDYWMREIEIATISEILRRLPPRSRVLDIGCGNGYSTMRLLGEHTSATFVGGDFSAHMIEAACRARADLSLDQQRSITFEVMDVTNLSGAASMFDAVISDRCLINLTSREAQRVALREMASTLVPGGVYIALENFTDGQENLNRARPDWRLDLIAYLRSHGIATGIHFMAAHEFSFYASSPCGPLPVTEQVTQEVVTLPLHSHMPREKADRVIDAVRSFVQEQRPLVNVGTTASPVRATV